MTGQGTYERMINNTGLILPKQTGEHGLRNFRYFVDAAGQLKNLLPLENGHRFAKDIGGSKLVVFDDLGHMPQEEDPARTVAEVRRFLAKP